MGELAIVTEQILDMDPARRARVRPVSTSPATGRRLADRPGEALFLKACSYCHSVGQGVRVGPDLMGVTARRDREWLTSFMMAPDALLARRDPIAMALNEAFPDVTMPNLGLSRDDAEDLMRYLTAETQRASTRGGGHSHTDGHRHD